MGGGRRTETFVHDSASLSSSNQRRNSGGFRFLTKTKLGGVIFGCMNQTLNECLRNQLFGLPPPHFSYVKNIDPGMPLFLFNYSTRELYGIYEATSSRKMNINPYGWTSDASGRKSYPAQVQMRLRLQCKPLAENLFKPIIQDNYYNESHFWFELDHIQAGNLIFKFSSSVVAPIRGMPQNEANWNAGECTTAVMNETFQNTQMKKNGESSSDWDGYPAESIFLVGGHNGVSLLSTLESYSPSNDVVKSFKPMNSVRAYAAVAKLCGELFVIGGGTVESYRLAENKWTIRSPLNTKKGTLAGATWNDRIFAIGGGNLIDSFSEVEMYDPQVGRWINTMPMLQKRSCLAAAELNGVLYAIGGYDGSNYLAFYHRTAERFDPREHSWTKITSMSTRRACHALVVLDGKLYALGGYDGYTMMRSTEIYDPRLETWMAGEPMNLARGYSAAAVLQESIYVIGGIKDNEEVVDVIECYKHGQGWQTPNLRGIGKKVSVLCYSPKRE